MTSTAGRLQKATAFFAGTLAFAIIFAIVGGIAYVIYWLVASTRTELAVALVAAAGTLFVTLGSIIGTRYYERRSKIEQHLREKKVPIYEELLTFMFELFYAKKLGRDAPTEADTMKFLAKFTRDAMIWGSDEVIGAWVAWRVQAGSDPAGTKSVLLFEKILLAVRKDLGHANRGLGQGRLLSMFMNDMGLPGARGA